jgi:hypothetical protein
MAKQKTRQEFLLEKIEEQKEELMVVGHIKGKMLRAQTHNGLKVEFCLMYGFVRVKGVLNGISLFNTRIDILEEALKNGYQIKEG